MRAKKFLSAFCAIMSLLCMSRFSAFAASSNDGPTITPLWTDVRTMEFGVTYQGCKARETVGAAFGPEKYLLHTDSATSATLIFEHTDTLSPNYYDPAQGTTPPDKGGDMGFYVEINDGEDGYYWILRNHEEIEIELPSGYSVIEVYAHRYVPSDATYTIRVDRIS